MKKILMALTILVATVAASIASANNTPVTALATLTKPVYIRVNQNIAPTGQYDSVQIERNKGGWFSADKYTLRLTFRFKRKGAYGAKDGSGSQLIAIKQGNLLQVSDVQLNPSGYKASDAFYLSAEGPSVSVGDGQSTRESVYLQILGNNADSISKLTVGELEKVFEGVISFVQQ